MRDHLDTHVAARFLSRFGLAIGLNELLYLEREITSGSHRCIGVQEAREPGNGSPGHRERHIYSMAISIPGRTPVALYAVWDPESRRVVSVLPPSWAVPHGKLWGDGGKVHDGRTSRKDPRDDAYQRERRPRREPIRRGA